MDVSVTMTWISEKTEEAFISIEVKNPRTHISREKALYTDYEINVKTNNIAFSKPESCVRRRYSDFQWLRKRLTTYYKWVVYPPELPPKRLFGRFKRQFLKHRQQGLQRFLEGVVKQNTYLSDVALHLFLQSDFQIKEIERHLNGTDSGGEIVDALESPGRGCKNQGLCRSMTNIQEIPSEKEANNEHDSGYCYSTTSSVNDLLYATVGKNSTRDDSRYYLSLPADLDKVTKAIETIDRAMNECRAKKTDLLQSTRSDSGHPLTSSSHSSGFDYNESISDDDFALSDEYDADDEYDRYTEWCGEYSGGLSFNIRMDKHSTDTRDFYRNRLYRSDEVSNLIEKNIELLRSRRPVSERAMYSDDSDDCFHESEYDVIESGDNLEDISEVPEVGQMLRCQSYSETKPKRKISRSSSQNESAGKPGKKKGKVQSLPNIPAGIGKKVARSLTFNNSSNVRDLRTTNHDFYRKSLFGGSQERPLYGSFCRTGKSGEDSAIPLTSDPDCRFRGVDIFDSNFDTAAESNPEAQRLMLNKARANSSENEVTLSFRRPEQQKHVCGRFEVTIIEDEKLVPHEDTTFSLPYIKHPVTHSKTLPEKRVLKPSEVVRSNLLSPLIIGSSFEDHSDKTPTNQDPVSTGFIPKDIIDTVNGLLDRISCSNDSSCILSEQSLPVRNIPTLDDPPLTKDVTEVDCDANENVLAVESNCRTFQSIPLLHLTDHKSKNCKSISNFPMNPVKGFLPVVLNTYEVISDIPVSCNLDEYCILDGRRTPVNF